MIRVRRKDGSVEPVDNGAFVELVNDKGEVATALTLLQTGEVLQIVPGTDDSRNYEQVYRRHGVRFVPSAMERG